MHPPPPPQPPPFKKLKREGPPPTSSPHLNAGRVRLPIAPKPGEDDDMWMSRWQALEDPKCIWALGPVLAQLTVGRTGLFHSPWNANPAALSGSALHNISSCVLEVLVAGRKYVDESALRAWAGVIGASSEWTEIVVEIVAATRGPLPIPVSAPSPEDLGRIGSDALRACALLCLGVPGSELVLAKRLEERRWGEVIVGVAEGWYRAGEVFVSLAAANISGAAGAAARLGVSMIAPGPSNSGRI
ncbi:hypothetical protein FRC12_000829 [Ceratobasidium sp. 428]|nr:hypothetical protein FRC12_000829 [Ceratobasidium sp. 428]